MGNSLKNRRRIKEYAEPRGLYPECSWDRRYIRKEILSGKLAPCFPGEEGNPDNGINDRVKEKIACGDLEECPICLLYYPGGLNRMTCCKQSMCTECYLQVKNPPHITPSDPSRCPFCKSEKFNHIYSGPLTNEQKKALQIEQQKVAELERKREEERQATSAKEDIKANNVTENKKTIINTRASSFSNSSSILSASSDNDNTSSNNNIHTHANETERITIQNNNNNINQMNESDLTDLEQAMLEEALRISLLESKMNNNNSENNNNNNNNSENNEVLGQEIEDQEDGLDAKFNVPSSELPVPLMDDDDGEEGDEINQAILLSLKLQDHASSSSSSSTFSS